MIVDAVTTLARHSSRSRCLGHRCYLLGTQKCLSCIPGLSPVSFSPRAAAKITNRKNRVQSWFLDANLVMGC